MVEEYYKLMLEIEELKKEGFIITIKPSMCRENKNLIKQYNNRLKPEKWVNVKIKYNNEKEKERIYQIRDLLYLAGVKFDTGYSYNEIDWEIDWSFKYIKGEK